MKKILRVEKERRKQHINELRNQLNEKDETHIHPFQKEKLLVYVCVFICLPYAIYQLWKKDSLFDLTEKVAQSLVGIIFVYSLICII